MAGGYDDSMMILGGLIYHVRNKSSKFKWRLLLNEKSNFLRGIEILGQNMARPLEHLVLFTVVATDSREGEENLIVQLAWEIVSISKSQVGFK